MSKQFVNIEMFIYKWFVLAAVCAVGFNCIIIYSQHAKWLICWFYFWIRELYRRYGTKCNGCHQGILPSDLVRKSRDNKVFHLNCLTCFLCRRELSTGDQLYIVDDNKFMCKEDYLLHKHGQHSSLSGECLNATIFYCIFFVRVNCVYVCNCCVYEQCVEIIGHSSRPY